MKIGPNALLSFAIEMVALGIYVWAPFAFLDAPVWAEILLAVVVVAVFALLWARFAAPTSRTRLSGVALLLFKMLVFAPALVLLALRYGRLAGIIGGALVVVNVVAEYLQNKNAPASENAAHRAQGQP